MSPPLKAPLFIGLALLLTALASAQERQQTWTCPSPSAQAACESFKGSKTTLNYGDYVCFREDEYDQYINITTSESTLQWSAYDADGIPKPTATANSFILGWVTNHGVEDDSLPPGFMAAGVWKSPNSPYFSQSPDQTDTKVSVTSTAIIVDKVFTNIRNTKTQYHLTIDRDSNRFLQVVSSGSGKYFQKSFGHCITGASKPLDGQSSSTSAK